MADWRTALLKNLGYKPTPQNMRFLSNWQRWEGGHTNNDARYNWLNTTKDAPGSLGKINSVGVRKFNSFQNGIRATAATLKNGRYQDVLDALASGDPYAHAPSAGLQTWVSGSPTGNPGYAAKVLGSKAAARAGVRPRPAAPGPSPAAPRSNLSAFAAIKDYVFEDDPEFLAMLSGISDQVAQETGMVDRKGSVQPIKPAHDVIGFAQSQLGKPYVFGSGPDTSSFDCSDLIQWAYGQVGIELPRTTFGQIKAGRGVKWEDLQPGDLIFPTNHHVVMYVGNGKVIAAPRTGTVVQYQPVSQFKNPVAIRRVR